MIDDQNLTPQTVSLVDVQTGVIYRYKEITVAADLNCTLTYTPVNPNSKLQDIQLFFDELPEVYDVIRELKGMVNSNLIVAAIVELDEPDFGKEQDCGSCPVCEEMGDEESPENFEKHCQMYAELVHDMILNATRVGKLDEALDVVGELRKELPYEMNKRISEIIRERAHSALKSILSGGEL